MYFRFSVTLLFKIICSICILSSALNWRVSFNLTEAKVRSSRICCISSLDTRPTLFKPWYQATSIFCLVWSPKINWYTMIPLTIIIPMVVATSFRVCLTLFDKRYRTTSNFTFLSFSSRAPNVALANFSSRRRSRRERTWACVLSFSIIQ